MTLRTPSQRFSPFLILSLAAVYGLLGIAALSVTTSTKGATALWPSSGVALAFLLVWGRRCWPGIALGSIAANFFALSLQAPRPGLATEAALLAAIAAGAALQGVVASTLIRRLTGERRILGNGRDMLRSAVLAVVPTSAISATIGVSTLAVAGLLPTPAFFRTWFTWYAGDLSGILIFTPFLVCWSATPKPNEIRGSRAEAALLLCTAAFFLLAIFGSHTTVSPFHWQTNLVLFPLLLWAAVRFGLHGMTSLVALYACTAAYGTAHGHGPFADGAGAFVTLQLYLAIVAATGLAASATLEEQREAELKINELLAEKQRRLESAEVRLAAVASNAPVILFAVDSEGIVRLSEGRGLQALGFRPGQLVGTSVWDLYKDVPESAANIRRALAGEEFSNVIELGAGGPTLQTSFTPSRDAQGRLTGTIGVSVDITALKKAETERQALLEETQRQARHLKIVNDASALFAKASLNYQPLLDTIMRAVAESFHQGCMIRLKSTDSPHLHIAAFYFANEPAMQAMRAQQGQLHPIDSDDVYSRVLRENRAILLTTPDEVRAATPASMLGFLDRFPLAGLLVVPMRVRERVIGTMSISLRRADQRFTADDQAIIQDIADRAAQAVENARLYQDAQRAARVREEFLAVASHELRTPLTTFKMQIYLLRRLLSSDKLGPHIPPGMEELLADSDEQGTRLERLIADLLDVSRLTTGRLTLNRKPIDLSEVTRETVRRLQTEIQGSRCTVTVRADQPAPGHLDKGRIEQVITNLLTNALKFGRGLPIEIDVAADQGLIRLSVSDQGIGISKDNQARIFERFERAVSERSFGGLGLGLFIAGQIVQSHGGRIAVESEPGAGARFTVELPAGAPPI